MDDPTPQWIWQHPGWPTVHWDETAVRQAVQTAADALARADGAWSVLHTKDAQTVLLGQLIDEATATAAIEGIAMDAAQVHSSALRALGLDPNAVPEPGREVAGLVQVQRDALEVPVTGLCRQRLLIWHTWLFPTGRSGFLPIEAGALRRVDPMEVVSNKGGRERVHFRAPTHDGLALAVDSLFEAWRASHTDLAQVAWCHLWMLTLHPFADGNGRLARATTDAMLRLQRGRDACPVMLSPQLAQHRQDYYHALERAQRGGLDVTKWIVFFLSQVEHAAQRARARIQYVLHKTAFWAKYRDVSLSPRQIKVINRLLDAGPDAFVGGVGAARYASIAHTSKATATRELAQLVALGIFVRGDAGGRSTTYRLLWSLPPG